MKASDFIESESELSLISSRIIGRLKYGLHLSNRLGNGMEFSQFRAYQAGDDPRRLDWKLLARTAKLFVREAEIEQHIRCNVILDASASMNYVENGKSKWTYAILLSSVLLGLAHRQGDELRLKLVHPKAEEYLLSTNNGLHISHVNHILTHVKPAGKWIDSSLTSNSFGHQRSMVLLISDLYETAQFEEIKLIAKKMAARKHELIVFHLLGNREFDLDFDDLVELEDLESAKKIVVRTKETNKAYAESMKAYWEAMYTSFRKLGIVVKPMNFTEDLTIQLAEFLKQRAAKI